MLSPNKLSKFFYLPFLLTGLLISGCNLDVAIKGEGTVVVQNQAAEEKHCDQDNCRFSYGLETVTAIPQPAPGYAFFKWQDRCENVVSCAINLSTGDRKITAIFKPEGAGLELARADLLAETLYSEVFNGFDDFMQQWPTLPSIIDNVEQQLLDSLPPHLKQTEDAFGGLVGEAQLNIIHSTVTNPSSGLSANLSFPEGSISELCEAMLKGGKAYVTHNDQSQTYARQVWSLQLGGSSTHYSGNNPLLFGATVADFLAQNLLDNVDLNAPGHENWLLAFNQEITRLTDWNARTGHFQNETTLNDWAMNNSDDNVIGNRMPLMPNEEMGYEH